MKKYQIFIKLHYYCKTFQKFKIKTFNSLYQNYDK